MTTKALITKAELLRMANIAKEYGVIVEKVHRGITIRVAPHHGNPPATSAARVSDRRPVPDKVRPPIQPPLNKYEEAVMKSLAAVTPAGQLRCVKLKLFGAATREKLLSRQYVIIQRPDGGKSRDETIRLSEKGIKDWEAHL